MESTTIVTFRIVAELHSERVDVAYFRSEERQWEVFGEGFRCAGHGATLEEALQSMVKQIRADKSAGLLDADAGDGRR